MIEIESNGRLGNKLNYFIIGMYLHEVTGLKFIPEKINGFIKTYDIKDGIVIENKIRTSNFKNLDDVINRKCGIIVDNMINKYDKLKEIKDIKSYLIIENEHLYEKPDKDELVIHIRLGDYLHINNGIVIDKELYLSVIRDVVHTKCTILTDSPNHQFIQDFIDIGCNIRCKSELEDFIYLKNSNKICISNSTFSWMAAYISSADKIYWPISANKWPYYNNPGIDDADLRPYDKNNWILL